MISKTIFDWGSVPKMNEYFLKVKFEDKTDKVIQISQSELWGILNPDIIAYCTDKFIDSYEICEITDVWIDDYSNNEIDLDEFFKDYRINISAVEHKFPEHKNEDVVLETIKEGTYEYVLCSLSNKQKKVTVDFEKEVGHWNDEHGCLYNVDVYSDEGEDL